ncbi:uncharacterized protein PHACADRAFT_249704 [Phanerochaete carnosa HHB-10118-sp]|uniref:Arf-GAP domain-containing protein n=1 Tax=Phanerochaete carnosa (strain HHB-10118-sp) TaxID=650164 RepID=K5V928_PHACS|nr:uncharacterized protein PHACADRAFT_249704 [Phanerochaete carnosa HHB-10118-sp]EKM59301.1 hypothetical protein PHACADRAFT_249704 [Phanerochaete carnosa HHB-10118-sp]
MDQAVAKRILQELIKNEELGNKKCIDCGNPNPQWASLSFAVFLCLQCAGVHRGFGVHISFVRSVSMDTWHEEQIKRMKLGGNAPFKKSMQEYPADGGWKDGMSSYDTYHTWAATQYREKLDADLAGKPWSPSSPPAGTAAPSGSLSPPNRPGSAQGLRKSRASTRNTPSRSESPFSGSPASTPNPPSTAFQDQKAANEAFFANLGQANATRPADLPPSQGGRYQGFGNTPSPATNPSFGLSSAAAPSLSDFQGNPVAALGKSWSLFSSAVVGATRTIQENVIRPGMEKVRDPEFQASVKGYVSEAGKRAGEVTQSANTWTKQTLGVDVAESVGGAVGAVRGRMGAGPQHQGYGVVQQGPVGESSSLYQDHEEDDFFDQYNSPLSSSHPNFQSPTAATSLTSRSNSHTAKKSVDDWDEWKDF